MKFTPLVLVEEAVIVVERLGVKVVMNNSPDFTLVTKYIATNVTLLPTKRHHTQNKRNWTFC
jgi:hypothetical protein